LSIYILYRHKRRHANIQFILFFKLKRGDGKITDP
jgi:hypothetical protein